MINDQIKNIDSDLDQLTKINSDLGKLKYLRENAKQLQDLVNIITQDATVSKEKLLQLNVDLEKLIKRFIKHNSISEYLYESLNKIETINSVPLIEETNAKTIYSIDCLNNLEALAYADSKYFEQKLQEHLDTLTPLTTLNTLGVKSSTLKSLTNLHTNIVTGLKSQLKEFTKLESDYKNLNITYSEFVTRHN